MPRTPPSPPIGLHLARAAKVLERAFDDALAEADGSRPMWLILLSLRQRAWGTQRELAAELGIQGATLTHHLAALERDGLVARSRDPENRRIQRVELTPDGEAAFDRLRGAAAGFDRRLRDGLSDDELARLRAALDQLVENVSQPSR